MFKEITIKQSQSSSFDLGQIVECLLFYEKVNFVCSFAFYRELILQNKINTFLSLAEFENFTVHLEETILAFNKRPIIGIPNDCIQLAIVRVDTLANRFERVIYDITKKKGYSERLTRKILKASNIIEHPNNLSSFMLEDLNDQVYIKRLIAHSLNHYHPEIEQKSEEIQFNVIHIEGGGVILSTNIDMTLVKSLNPNVPFENLTFFGNLIHSRDDIMTASRFNSDLLTSPLNTSIISSKINTIIEKSTGNLNQINSFQDVHLPKGKSIAQAINSGHKSLSDFQLILEKAEKFKSWLKDIDKDANLLREYHEAISKQTWIDKLPGKGLRWSFFTGTGLVIDKLGAGGIGTLAGMGISAGDAFLLDKICKGWRPNSFVNKELEKFLS